MREQGIHGRFHARRDDAAGKAAVLIDDLDVRGRAEIHHDARRPIEAARGNGIRHAVRTQVGTPVIRDVDQLTGGLHVHHQQIHAEHGPAHFLPHVRRRRHDRCQRHAFHRFVGHAAHVEQAAEQHVQFVSGSGGMGRDAPHVFQLVPFEEAERGLRVSYIDGYQHSAHLPVCIFEFSSCYHNP